jgi:hypothetical protein
VATQAVHGTWTSLAYGNRQTRKCQPKANARTDPTTYRTQGHACTRAEHTHSTRTHHTTPYHTIPHHTTHQTTPAQCTGPHLEVVNADRQEGKVDLLPGQEVAHQAQANRRHDEHNYEDPSQAWALQALPATTVVPGNTQPHTHSGAQTTAKGVRNWSHSRRQPVHARHTDTT